MHACVAVGASSHLRSDAARNRARLLLAGTSSVHRHGLHVPLAVVAAEAGVGIGTLYRHFATREDLLAALTHRSFEQVLANARSAERDGRTPTDCLRLFVEAAIGQRNELVLPLHGGPPVVLAATLALRDEVHAVVRRVVDRGVADGSLLPGTDPSDVIALGAALAQPRPSDPDWDATCRRLLATYLRGLAGPRTDGPSTGSPAPPVDGSAATGSLPD